VGIVSNPALEKTWKRPGKSEQGSFIDWFSAPQRVIMVVVVGERQVGGGRKRGRNEDGGLCKRCPGQMG
jgi:hypothetical protein